MKVPRHNALTFQFILCQRPSVPPAHKADILRFLLLAISIAILAPLTNVSKIYHSIRGQDTIKLYVIFNALEVGNDDNTTLAVVDL